MHCLVRETYEAQKASARQYLGVAFPRLTERKDRVPSEDFLQEGIYIGQILPIFEAGRAVGANNAIKFHLRLLLGFWVKGHREVEVCHRGNCLNIKGLAIKSCSRDAMHRTVSAPPVINSQF
jgi:hypothetical protein